jgi:hypothetical protein
MRNASIRTSGEKIKSKWSVIVCIIWTFFVHNLPNPTFFVSALKFLMVYGYGYGLVCGYAYGMSLFTSSISHVQRKFHKKQREVATHAWHTSVHA